MGVVSMKLNQLDRLKAENKMYRDMVHLHKYAMIFFNMGVKAEREAQLQKGSENGQNTQTTKHPTD